MKTNPNQFNIIKRELETIKNQLDMITKKISNISTPPKPWLTFDKQNEARELREKNPEIFDYVCEVLKLYF